MDTPTRAQWTNEVLDEVFLAVIAAEPLRKALIFKGARILNLHLGDSRESLDIDSNAAPGWSPPSPAWRRKRGSLGKSFRWRCGAISNGASR